MNSNMQAHVLQLLKSSCERKQKIKLLRYELLQCADLLGNEIIAEMSVDEGKGEPCNPRRFLDRVFYIVLNYRELADKINTEVAREIAAELIELENAQNRLNYYVSLLEGREAQIIRRAYFDGRSGDQIAEEMGIVRRTAYKIKERALENLTRMYEYMDNVQG